MSVDKSSLPASWELASLGDLGRWYGGGTPSKSNPYYWTDGTIPWVSPKDMKSDRIHDSEDHITSKALHESATNLVPIGSVLIVTRSGILRHSLPVAVTSVECTINQDLKALATAEGIDPDYIAYALRFIESKILSDTAKSGTTVQSIDFAKLRQINIPVAPTSEQRRIVIEIERQFSRMDAAIGSLERAKAHLARYQAATLKAAFEGHLVPTEAYLAQMERREYASAEQLLLHRRPFYRKKGPSSSIVGGLPRISKGWSWARVDDLVARSANPICAGPFGTIFKARDFCSQGVPIIFLRHVKLGKFTYQRPTFMDDTKWRTLFVPYSVFGGELLIAKLGDPPGTCAIYPVGRGPAMLTPDVMKMEVDEELAAPRYLMHYFNSAVSRQFTTGAAFGTTRLRITLPLFREMPVPVAPRPEQDRIVSEIERRLSVADALQRSIEEGLLRISHLRQSLLMNAFTGKLTAQDPDDEPTVKLLERILQKHRVSTDQPRRTGRRRPASAIDKPQSRRATH